ncbi:MAG: hypothetical protein M1840_001334 [Geoglossum simile]|nr:MAG: hypothetical protein M1840_001334 [Geoglossum simile]
MRWTSNKDSAPWLKNLRWSGGDALSRLNDEITAFEAYMSPTIAEGASREAAVNQLRVHAAVALPGAFLEEYGSYNTGIYMPSSDIDFRLASSRHGKQLGERGPSSTRPSALRENHRQLRALTRHLRTTDSYTDIGLIPARIPVGFATHRATGIRFQITGAGEVNAHDEYVKTYLAEFPALRPLYFVVKNMLWIRGFTETFTGGLGSYPLFMTIVAWLRLGKSQSITIWSHSNGSLGRDLRDYLEFYGSFNYYRQGLSIEPPRILTKGRPGGKPSKSERETMAKDPILSASSKMCVADKIQRYRLYLQDPANPLNDLGLKCYGIKHIRAIFRYTLTQLRRDMIQFEQNPSLFEDGGLLRSVVGGQFDRLEQSRARDSAKETSCTF